MKTVIASSIVLILASIALVTPWYPVTLSRQTLQINAYTTESILLTTNYEKQPNFGPPQLSAIVFNLPAPVNLAGACGFSCWVSQSFYLQSGSVIQVAVTECQYCVLTIDNTNASFGTAGIIQLSPSLAGLAPSTGIARVADSGNYVVTLGNIGNFVGTVTSISISVIASTLIVAQPTNVTQTTIAFSTTDVASYSQSSIPFYATIGVVPSVIVLVLLALALLLSVLVDRGIVTMSTKHHRRRRKR